MEDQELFEKLKRDGECWHELESIIPANIEIPYFHKCKKCGFLTNDCQEECNPQFLTHSGFFWLWERAQEKEWWNDFFSPYDPWGIEELIHRTKFTEALKQYLGESNG